MGNTRFASLVFGVLFFSFTSIAAPPVEKNLRVGFSKIDITPYDVSAPFYDSALAEAVTESPGLLCERNKCYESYAALIQSEGVRTSSVIEKPAYMTPYGAIYIGGFAPYYPVPFIKNRFAIGVHDPIWARAVAIEGENKKTVILISTDLPGLSWKYINPVRREISKVFHIPVENIVITSTHDHGGPDASGYWTAALSGHLSEYTTQLKQWMLDSAVQAIRNLEPARMATLTATHLSCYNPRTKELKKDPDCHLPTADGDYARAGADQYDEMIIQSDKRDPIVRNTMITVMNFTRPQSGETIGTFINWHNHPETAGSANLFITSDFPNYLREYVEGELGGTAVYFSGTLGGQIGPGSPVPLWTREKQPIFQAGVFDIHGNPVRAFAEGNRWEKTRSIGYEIGSEVVKAVRENRVSPLDTLALSVKTEPLDVAPVNLIHVVASGPAWTFDVEEEDRMHRYAWRCLGRWGCVRSDVSLMQIGDLSLITAPGEIDPVYLYGREASVVDYGKKGKWNFPAMEGIKPLLKGPHVAVLGQANNYLSYLVPESDNVGALNFKHPNHYEEFVTVNKHFGNDLANKWMEMLGSSTRFNNRKILPQGKSK